jgi:hypothetical protein
MTLPTCPHEPAVIRAVRDGDWPDAADAALRAHAGGCEVCRETVAIAAMLRQADAADDVHVPTASQVWWRLAVRARLEREQAAARPLVWLQGLAAASGLGLAAAAVGVVQPWIASTVGEVSGRAVRLVPELAWAARGAWTPDAPMPLAVVAAVVGGVLVVAAGSTALYLWLVED